LKSVTGRSHSRPAPAHASIWRVTGRTVAFKPDWAREGKPAEVRAGAAEHYEAPPAPPFMMLAQGPPLLMRYER
jgi:hypothetical protein